ncbi:MAG: Hsp33 family molecular chaperone HslO [Myxococcota bacterium]
MRAVTFDGAFRVMTCRTTDLVREAVRLQKVEGNDARTFGELLTGAILVRETMSPAHRVQAILSLSGHGSMIADTHPPDDADVAMTRGLVSRQGAGVASGAGLPLLAEGAILKVIRSLPRGRLHQSIVEAKAGGMGEALMSYMLESEQVFATLGVVTLVDGPRVIASGGFLVQLLPEISDGPLAIMTERLAHDFLGKGQGDGSAPSGARGLDAMVVAHDADRDGLARYLMDELLFGMKHEVLADSALRFGCDCNMARVLTAMATLGRDELTSMVRKGEVIDLTCEYCTTSYSIGAEQLRSLLEPT